MTRKNLAILTLGIMIGTLLMLSVQKEDHEIPAATQIVNTQAAFASPGEEQTRSTETFRVVRVVDGDTIELNSGDRVRLLGIDTPETVKPNSPIECFGKEASEYTRKLLEGENVTLIKDLEDRDKYGRLLRYVYLGDLFVNKSLIEEGYARVYTYPPNVAHAHEFVLAERSAREGKRGLWGDACKDSPTTIKITDEPTAAPSHNCSIKGNIGSTGEKIYHTPDCPYYTKTRIDTTKGERMFCSEDAALEAGWRKAKNCA